MVHSNIPFSSVIVGEARKVYEAINNGVEVAFNDERYAQCVPNSLHLPNIYKKDFNDPFENEITDTLKVICGGAVRPMKNHINQAYAAIMLANELGVTLEFNCNLGINHGGHHLIENLKTVFANNKKHKLVNIPWKSQSEFIKGLKDYHIGMQVSMSESFNATAADYTTAGLPMVVSHEVRWASDNAKADCSDAFIIKEKMKECHKHVSDNQKNLNTFCEMAIKKWERTLNQ